MPTKDITIEFDLSKKEAILIHGGVKTTHTLIESNDEYWDSSYFCVEISPKGSLHGHNLWSFKWTTHCKKQQFVDIESYYMAEEYWSPFVGKTWTKIAQWSYFDDPQPGTCQSRIVEGGSVRWGGGVCRSR